MSKFFAQWGEDSIVLSVIESEVDIVGANIAACDGYHVLGKKREGGDFVAVPSVPRYKVWDKPQFIFMLGMSVLKQINSGESDELSFYKYILENSPHVDLNVLEFRSMVESLHVSGLIGADKLAALLVQE